MYAWVMHGLICDQTCLNHKGIQGHRFRTLQNSFEIFLRIVEQPNEADREMAKQLLKMHGILVSVQRTRQEKRASEWPGGSVQAATQSAPPPVGAGHH